MNKKEKTALSTSVGADVEQSSQILNNEIITENFENCNSNGAQNLNGVNDFQRELLLGFCPGYFKTVTMGELYETIFDSEQAVIEDILYPGVYILAGTPKVGKSFLMAQLAYHVSKGRSIWDLKTQKGTVLYLALEDNYQRLQGRLFKMFGEDISDNFHLAININPLENGLIKQLKFFYDSHNDTKLIIIDTLQKVRNNNGEGYSYANDYEIISQLKEFADENKVCILLVHHTRKQDAEDKFDMISGTNGLLGASDGALLLYKEKRTSLNATLEISGRDQQDQKLLLNRNTETLAWELEKRETELWKTPPDPLLEKISTTLLKEKSYWEGSATELCQLLDLDIKPNTLSLKLNISAGKLSKEYKISYENRRSHDGRKIILSKEIDEEALKN